jgi:Na+-driven multidrug efflux pump
LAKLTFSEQGAGGDTASAKAEINPRGNPKKILRLAIPVGLESVFQMGFNLIDQVVVGLLGADAVAAVGLSNSIASIALLLYASLGVGAGVMVARAFGRGAGSAPTSILGGASDGHNSTGEGAEQPAG